MCEPTDGQTDRTGGLNACLTIALMAIGAAPSFSAATYNTNASVNVRSGPGTGYTVICTETSGAQFTLVCQWKSGTNIDGNATWDKVTFANGLPGAITDYYTTTPSWNSYAPGADRRVPHQPGPRPAPASHPPATPR
jgi:uncharacterized protein YgiM (DUF1202 family)